jgi:hypothetical protein
VRQHTAPLDFSRCLKTTTMCPSSFSTMCRMACIWHDTRSVHIQHGDAEGQRETSRKRCPPPQRGQVACTAAPEIYLSARVVLSTQHGNGQAPPTALREREPVWQTPTASDLRNASHSHHNSTPSPGGCSGQRACQHAQLGIPETSSRADSGTPAAVPHGSSTRSLTRPAGYTGDQLTGRPLEHQQLRLTLPPLAHSHAQLGIRETSPRAVLWNTTSCRKSSILSIECPNTLMSQNQLHRTVSDTNTRW